MLKIAFAAACVVAALPGPVLAQERLPDVRVYYGDLDLTDPQGIQTLDRRLTRAIEASCPDDTGLVELARRREVTACRKAKQASIAALRQSALAAANTEKNLLASAR